MKAAVTGANGLVGAHLVRGLVSAGNQVLAFSRSEEPRILTAVAGKGDGYHYKNINILDERRIGDALRSFDVECLFHCAVQRVTADTENVDSSAAWSTNVNGTAAVLRAARHSGVRAVVHSSAMMVFDLDARSDWVPEEDTPVCPSEPNGITVTVAEELVRYYRRRYSLPTVILRYPGLYGPGKRGGFITRCIEHMKNNPEKPLHVRSNRRADFLWVGDVVEANLLAARTIETLQDRDLYHIGSGGSWSVREIGEKIREIFGCSTPLTEDTPLPDRDFRLDCSRARVAFGYRPHTIEYGLRQTVAEWDMTT